MDDEEGLALPNPLTQLLMRIGFAEVRKNSLIWTCELATLP